MTHPSDTHHGPPCQAAKLLDLHLTTRWSFHCQLRRKFRTIGNDFALVDEDMKEGSCAHVMHHEMGINMNIQELCQPMCVYIYIYAYKCYDILLGYVVCIYHNCVTFGDFWEVIRDVTFAKQ